MNRIGLIHISKTGFEKVRSKVSSADCQSSLEMSELIASAILCPLYVFLSHPREGAKGWLNQAALLWILCTILYTYPQIARNGFSAIFPKYEPDHWRTPDRRITPMPYGPE